MDKISFGAQSRIDHTRTVRFRIVRITAPRMYVLYTTNCHGGSRFLRVAGEFHILTICQDNKDIICVLRMASSAVSGGHDLGSDAKVSSTVQTATVPKSQYDPMNTKAWIAP